MKRLLKFISLAAITSVLLLSIAQPLGSEAVKTRGANGINKATHKVIKNEIHLKLSAKYNITLKKNLFYGEPTDQVNSLNSILSVAKRVRTERLLTAKASNKAQKRILAATDGYYIVKLAKDANVESIATQLKALSIVETAYGAPNLAPMPSDNYVSQQTYRNRQPRGVNTQKAAQWPGGKGDNVKIVDVEYSWNTNHEDLSKARTALVANGTPVDPFNNNNHGTAVLGEMIADDNGYGVTGIVPNAQLELINVDNAENGYDLFASLFVAALTTKPGDVILIEQQMWGPTPDAYDYVPVEWVPEYYDIIKALTDLGRVVVEPAGNGNQNLDDATYYGNTFPMNKPDSGAIIVGSADNCDGSTTLRGRLGSSTYGSRVNLQGPGNCVVTTGYGWLSGAVENEYYTYGFSGTSSASPVVAAAAASLSSTYQSLNDGAVLTPIEIRDILMKSGSKQNTGSDALPGNIGSYPNLAQALKYADITAPTTPGDFKVTLNAEGQPVLSWSRSTDNYKLRNYRIIRADKSGAYKKLRALSFTDTNVVSGGTYTYKVRAADYSWNKSAFTVTISVTIP